MGRLAARLSALSLAALVLAWTGGTALAQGQPPPEGEGGRGLTPAEPREAGSDAEAAGLRLGAPRGAARRDAAAPWTRREPRETSQRRGLPVAEPAAAARRLTARPAPTASRRTGRLPRPPAARQPPSLVPSAADQRALQTGRRGIAVPAQPRRPPDVPIVTERVQGPGGRVLSNANPLGRNAVVDPRTGEVVSYARTVPPEADPFAPAGLRLGTFDVLPAAEATLGYDSNPRRVDSAVRGSLFTQSYGEVQARSDWSRHELTGRLRGTYFAYAATPDVNRPEVAAAVTGRLDLTRDTRIETEARYNLTAQAPGSANLPSAAGTALARLPLVHQAGGTAGIVQDIGRLQLALRGSLDRFTYEDATTQNGTVLPQGTRNYNAFAARLRASYELTPGVRPFVEAAVEKHVFDTPLPSPGATLQGSTATTYRVGSTFELTRQLTGEVAVGYLLRDSLEPTFTAIRAPVVDAALVWTLSALTTVRLTAKTTVDESFTGAAGIQRRDVSAELEHAFRRWLIGTARLAYGQDIYAGTDRVDQRMVASLGLLYKASRNLQLRAEIRRETLSSNLPGSSYAANVVLFGLRVQR